MFPEESSVTIKLQVSAERLFRQISSENKMACVIFWNLMYCNSLFKDGRIYMNPSNIVCTPIKYFSFLILI